MTWHADTALLQRYGETRANATEASSIEAHLTACESCRRRLADVTPDRPRLDRLWTDIVDVVDRPRSGVVERVLRRVGVAEHLARLLAATPGLRTSWLAAIFLVLLAAAFTARGSEHGALFVYLVAAPLLPLGGVAAAYGPAVDPAYEIGAAAPLGGFRLLLVRAVAVVSTTTVVLGVAGVVLSEHGWMLAAWLLPALFLATAAVALSSWTEPLPAVIGLGSAWLVAVAAAVGPTRLRGSTGSELVDRLPLADPGVQVLFAVLVGVAAVVVAHRRRVLTPGSTA